MKVGYIYVLRSMLTFPATDGYDNIMLCKSRECNSSINYENGRTLSVDPP